MSPRYQYYAIVGIAHTVDDPFVVVRRGGGRDESFTTGLRWEPTERLDRIESGRDHFDAVPITEEQGRAFEQVQAQRVREARE